MGNTCMCCATDDGKKDAALDQYIKQHHVWKYPHKCPKLDKKEQNFYKVDLPHHERHLKSSVNYEILDEASKRQDLQAPDSIDVGFLEEICGISNQISSSNTLDSQNGGLSEVNNQNKIILLKQKRIEESVLLMVGGESGSGGRPLIRKPDNPYLEIDLIDPNDPILFEGEVQKYKPGFQAQFIDRWVQVTQKAFRYFVSRPAKDCPIIKPLLAIPILGIKSTSMVNYELPIKKTDTKALELAKHQFELFLKEDFVNYYLSSIYERHFSVDGKRTNSGIKFLEKNGSINRKFSPSKKGANLDLKEKYLKEEENLLEEPLLHAAMNSLNTHQGAWTNREEMWILEDRRLLFATKTDLASEEWTNVLGQLIADNDRPPYATN